MNPPNMARRAVLRASARPALVIAIAIRLLIGARLANLPPDEAESTLAAAGQDRKTITACPMAGRSM
jgi:hypothetical protein